MTVHQRVHDSQNSSPCVWVKEAARDTCSVKTLKRRLPIIEWLPHYTRDKLIQDIVAGVTVGLTAIPQGIAYAMVAGLPPEYGLYSAYMGCYVYLIFGSCKDVTIGPTAILAAMVAKYVQNYGPDFAVLATFLSGIVVLVLGLLNLGFLLDFISDPVISGFTTAAALQIASSQLKALFGLQGETTNTFMEAVESFIKNLSTIRLWDSVLGCSTMVGLILLKRLSVCSSRSSVPGFSTWKNILWRSNWFASLARNAVVVIFGLILAWLIKVYTNTEPFMLTGDIKGGWPPFQLPPFSTTVGNVTYTFSDMLAEYGPQSIAIPLISILESIAIAKAFSKGKMVDATQEMWALGMCNLVSSFVRSMPVTGSFTRTAINYASGVQTTAGGIFKGLLVVLALSLMTSTFYYIPKATLAGLIITAMFSMMDVNVMFMLWKTKKMELMTLVATMLACLSIGLEYGILVGVVIDACLLLFKNSRLNIVTESTKIGSRDVVIITPSGSLLYCSSDHLGRCIQSVTTDKKYQDPGSLVLVIDGKYVSIMDSTVTKNLKTVIADLEKNYNLFIMWNFPVAIQIMCEKLVPSSEGRFMTGSSLEDVVNEWSRGLHESQMIIFPTLPETSAESNLTYVWTEVEKKELSRTESWLA